MTPLIPEKPKTFQDVRRIMAMPSDFDLPAPDPWSDVEFEAFARQEPLPPNQSFQLPSEEPKEEQSCLF